MSVSGMRTRPIPSASSACSLLLAFLLMGCGGGKGDEASRLHLLTGAVEWGTEGGMFFQACGSSTLVPLSDPQDVLGDVHSFVSVYATGSPQAGWKAVRINYVPFEGFDCRFDWNGTMWRAAGNEPFWSARLLEDGLAVRLMDADRRVYPVRVDGLTFASQQGALELRLTEGLCQDTMADTRYGYTAELTVEGVTWQGCAFQGMAAVESR